MYRFQTILFQSLGLSDVNARIVAGCNGIEYILASYIAYALIDRVGRRILMLIGTFGQCIVMLLLAILGSINNGPAQIMSVILLFGFNTFFAIGWLGMAWLYVGVASFPRLNNWILMLCSLTNHVYCSVPSFLD